VSLSLRASKKTAALWSDSAFVHRRLGAEAKGGEKVAYGSLTEAERSTGLIAKMDYALKRFLWL
jgi:hypothetical protein